MYTSLQVADLPDPGHGGPFPPERHAGRTGVRQRHCVLLLAGAASIVACSPGSPPGEAGSEPASGGAVHRTASPTLVPQQSGTTQLLQAVSVVDERVIWVSGHGGTWARSRDGGTTWESGVVPGQDSLQFRDVHAVHADTAVLLAAGPGDRSRIFRTEDGGAAWTEVWRNVDPDGFFDCLDLWDPVGPTPRRGLAFSDAVEGRFTVLLTEDAGRSWSPLPAESLPPALDGEGGFAASGTCLVVVGDRHGWIGTGAGVAPRVLRTRDGGITWQAAPSPLPAGEAAGIASLVFQDTLTGWAFGGNLGDPASRTDNVAVTTDGGATWTRGTPSRMPGAIYGAALAPGSDPAVLITVGPGGADLTLDGGGSWMALDSLSSWAVGFSSPSTAWLVGPAGRITRVDLNQEGR